MSKKNVSTFDNDDWGDLIDEIAKSNCILVLGPETSLIRSNGEELCSNRKLAIDLASELEEKYDDLKVEELCSIALIYNYEKRSRNTLSRRVREFYEGLAEPNEIYEKLAELPFSLIINATYDKRIFKALTDKEKKPSEAYFNYRGTQDQFFKWDYSNERPKTPLIYYLYGSIDNDESLVITENDLLGFLVAVIKRDPAIPENIASVLKDGTNSFLFLGFGFKNWYLRILMYVLLSGDKNREGPSFALEDFSVVPKEFFALTSLFYREEHNIRFSELELKNFVKELNSRYNKVADKVAKKVKQPKTQPVQTKPIVFLCHEQEDKDFAVQLYGELKESGIEPWIDKEDLKGGDRWEKVIERTINKEIDYLIILNSKALLGKGEGYVNTEIKFAIKRQLRFSGQLRFIIPIIIDGSDLREDIEMLQGIVVNDPSDIDELVKAIKLDFKQR